MTDPEPLPEGHPLWQCSNLVLTPHIAGGLDLPETQDRMVNIAAGNIARLIRGEPLQNVVDLTAGY